MEDNSLRGFLARLEETGELVRIKEEVLPEEIFCFQWKLYEMGGPAVIFEKVKGASMPIVTNVLGTLDRLALACKFPSGKTSKEYRNMYIERLDNKSSWFKPRLVEKGPCKEVILRGNEARFDRLPIFKWHPLDSGPYITMTASITNDDKFGTNMGIYRMMLHDEKTSGIMCNIFQHQGIYLNKAMTEGKDKIDCAIALGGHPSVYVSAVTSMDIRDDELELVGALQGAPLEVVKAETSDLKVPANAEIILEGEISTTLRKAEAPFAEFEGYHEETMMLPVFKLNCITMRRDAMYLTITADREGEILRNVPLQAKFFRELRKRVTGFVDCWLPEPGRGYTLVASVKKYYPGWGQQAIYQVMAHPAVGGLVNNIIVVDHDIDPSKPDEWVWALSTRTDPFYDVVITKPMHVYPLNPGARERPGVYQPTGANEFLICSKMGIDATTKRKEERPTRGRVEPVEPPKEIVAEVERKLAKLGIMK